MRMTKKGNRKNNSPEEIEIFLIISVFSYNGTFRDFLKSGPGFRHLKTGYPIGPGINQIRGICQIFPAENCEP